MEHSSVLLEPFLFYSQEIEPRRMWDATLGLAGHSLALAQLCPNLYVYGSDLDAELLQLAAERIEKAKLQNRFFLKKANFAEDPFAKEAPFDIILLDLGISSFHLDYFERGFSFRQNAKLDMRLDPSTGNPLYDWLNKASLEEISQVLRNYGEEPYARPIAQEILRERTKNPLLTSGQLRQIVEKVYAQKKVPHKKRHVLRHPAVRTFQALRIFINHEIENLEKALSFLPERLSQRGRLFIISFHSLEDRVVKKAFSEKVRIFLKDPLRKSNFVAGNFRLLTPKPIRPSAIEIRHNPRSRSAKMRILEKIT
ncbi:MAG: 16S rRNA (cytosine(1402)-N(4))-methyltransferase RsmH [Leptospiraceae bacterium]|nr:16S rRNA (cytosine(1402)-N(4))-methyltransferase RsmH [Leptospiraceae bacterium]MDW8305736.1 16S rRNA (cytosine(1402)-N(4))-methyltransferase RsmH [Leptospiraceae bacterium]